MYKMKCIINKVSALIKKRTTVLRLIFFLITVLVILYALFILLDASGGIISFVSGTAFFLLKIVVRFSYALFLNTLPFIFPPVLLYLSACLFLKKRYLRYYVFLLLFSFYIIWFIKFVLRADCYLIGHMLKFDEILTALVQIYIFVSLVIPSGLCTVLASVFFVFKSILVFILPDLPLRYDDFGLILALFLFTFLYLNNIVFLIKKAGKLVLKINLPEKIFRKAGGGLNGQDK